MGWVTRELAVFAIGRLAGELVTLFLKAKSRQPDGSFAVSGAAQYVYGYFVDLTPNDIQRLQDKGITIQSGVSLSLPYEVSMMPDTVLHNYAEMRVVSGTISEGVTYLVLDDAPILGSGVDYRS